MKRFCGAAVVLFLLLTVRVYAQPECDYVLSFENVSLSGKLVEDSYFVSGFSQYGFYLDICGFYAEHTNTTDLIYAELLDDSGLYWYVYGTTIWDEAWKKAYVQASYLDETYSTYLDGTIKLSGGWYKISAKGGDNGVDNDGVFYITLFNKISGKGGFLDNGVASLSQEGRTKFKNLDKSKLLGLRKRLQTQPGQQRRRLKVSPSNRPEQ